MKPLKNYFVDGKIVDVAPNTLRPAPDNPRNSARHSEPEKFEGLKASLLDGFFEPLLVIGSTLEIVSGHQRVDAARELGLPTVPVVFLKDMDEKTKTLIRIKANGHASDFDLPKLRLQIETLPINDLPTLGLDARTLDVIAPLPNSDDSSLQSDEKWENLKFKLPKAAAKRINSIIEQVCEKQKCRPGTALTYIVELFAQDPENGLG